MSTQRKTEGQDAYYVPAFMYIHVDRVMKRVLLHAERVVDILHKCTHLSVNNRRLRHRSSLRRVRPNQIQLFACHLD